MLGHAGSNCAPRTTWGQYCLAVWRTMHATLPAADGVDPTRVLPHHGSNVAPLPLEDKAACLLLYHGRRRRHFNSCRHTAAETRTEKFQERYWERRGVDEYAWNCLVCAALGAPRQLLLFKYLRLPFQRNKKQACLCATWCICGVRTAAPPPRWRSLQVRDSIVPRWCGERSSNLRALTRLQCSIHCTVATFLLALCMSEHSSE